jgi:hypothetical protein
MPPRPRRPHSPEYLEKQAKEDAAWARIHSGSKAAPLRDEFANDNTFQPHEVQPEAITLGDDSDFQPIKVDPAAFKRSRRGKPIPNPAHRFLRDSDDD